MNRTRPRVTIQEPKARRDQPIVHDWEYQLWDQARKRHPAVQWWHGYRKVDGVMSDVCYVCDRVIVAVAANVNVTNAARHAVIGHKLSHRPKSIPAKLQGSTERNTA